MLFEQKSIVFGSQQTVVIAIWTFQPVEQFSLYRELFHRGSSWYFQLTKAGKYYLRMSLRSLPLIFTSPYWRSRRIQSASKESLETICFWSTYDKPPVVFWLLDIWTETWQNQTFNFGLYYFLQFRILIKHAVDIPLVNQLHVKLKDLCITSMVCWNYQRIHHK